MKRLELLLLISAMWRFSSPVMARRVIYAVTIGNNAPPVESTQLKPLHYADDDAVRYYELFRRAGPEVELLTVLDRESLRPYPNHAPQARPPTLANLRRILMRYKISMREDIERGDQP